MANERLTSLLIEAGFLDRAGTIGRKRFARAVGESSAARAAGRTYSHTYVSRWIAGTVPRDAATREAIAQALGSALGRTVTLDELGFSAPTAVDPQAGLAYPGTADDGVLAVAQLFEADLASAPSVIGAPTNIAAWNEASVSWLVGAQPSIGDRPEGPSRIGLSDVQRLRTMRETFDRLDSTFGGAHARNSLVQYLRTELPLLLRAAGTADVRRALFSAAGESTQLAAWMAYDAGLHGLAQRYFIQALGLADAGEDRLLAASILDAMSHQASFLGRYREAANMARAARLGTDSIGISILTSHFHIMEARALARIGEADACERAMGAAVQHFEQHRPGDEPAWIGYFDQAEIAAEMAHCHRDLGRPDLAVEHARRALTSTSGDYVRSDFFATMVLADALIDRGDLDEGCQVASAALGVGEGLRSARCSSYVAEFKERLRRHHSSPAVRTFADSARQFRLWRPSA